MLLLVAYTAHEIYDLGKKYVDRIYVADDQLYMIPYSQSPINTENTDQMNQSSISSFTRLSSFTKKSEPTSLSVRPFAISSLKMSTFVLILLGAAFLTVTATQPNPNAPPGAGEAIKNIPKGSDLDKPLLAHIEEGASDARIVALVPWNCYAVQKGNKCSCKILDTNWVMVRTACISPNEGNQLKVYAGAPNDKYSQQTRNATIFFPSDSEPSPPGVLFLHLNNSLHETSVVRAVNLTADDVDNAFGYVSGYRYEGNETYQSEYYWAHIIDKACRSSKEICGVQHQDNTWPNLTNDKSKATDFLDYYSKTTGKVYVLGVLQEHYTEEVAVYHKVKYMLPWIEKYLGIPVPKTLGS